MNYYLNCQNIGGIHLRKKLCEIENLEQLRVLQAGYSILVGVIDEPTVGIDTPADYAAFLQRQRGVIGDAS